MRKHNRKRNILSTVILVVLFLVGLSVMLYPKVSDWWNSRVQSRAIATYNQTVENMDDSEKEALVAAARAYNEQLATLTAPFSDYEQISGYEDLLDVSGTGVMGYITIPQISVELPIYHGTSAEVLNIAVGHLQGSSLPVGGTNTHAVISAHRGLPSARLFTDLDQLVVGDEFTITILDEIYTYEVEKILIVKPDQMEELAIIPGGDYVTLMTCTPYGINSHRLLVRAHRVETVYPHNIKVTADAVQLDSISIAPYFAVPPLLVLLIFWYLDGRRKKLRRRRKEFRLFEAEQPENSSERSETSCENPDENTGDSS